MNEILWVQGVNTLARRAVVEERTNCRGETSLTIEIQTQMLNLLTQK
jgi:hypothetical protein